ncbi:MAG: malonic semialdehyde reductase [Paludisphaera borealis]|uniref:malonic semialdehyde reductase n=1 Tax=Paludisphaera borealis TaxID=1387353 RepID=UPI00283C4547|nr:malonic semialdehyde reductase [Paludisphaera borealis]MDR3619079.1 malonic semialdehyde reductase [Paludisphaera borealis]
MSETNGRNRVDAGALDALFREARTHSVWHSRPVPEGLLREAFDLAKMGPTSANSSPARFVFLTTEEAKERLIPALMPGNVDKTRAASATVIVAQDMEFYEHLPRLFPYVDARSWFAGNTGLIADTAARNSSLQGAYLMLAARALGLDCGPMSGFDPEKVNAEFFPDGKWRANFLFNLGFGDSEKLQPRAPRFDFEEACRIL